MDKSKFEVCCKRATVMVLSMILVFSTVNSHVITVNATSEQNSVETVVTGGENMEGENTDVLEETSVEPFEKPETIVSTEAGSDIMSETSPSSFH